MPFPCSVARFFGGVFFANALPHLIAGVSGHPLQTPFASPPFKGFSLPAVNVGWALANLAVAYLLIVRLGSFDARRWLDAGVCLAGFGVMALQCARSFAPLHKKGPAPEPPVR